MKNDFKNKEGYEDPTAKAALDDLYFDTKAQKVMKTMKCTADLAGFEVIGILQVKCRKTGKVYTSVIDDRVDITVTETNIYDQEEIHPNCTVQILRNSVTGEQSIGWWDNNNAPVEMNRGDVDA